MSLVSVIVECPSCWDTTAMSTAGGEPQRRRAVPEVVQPDAGQASAVADLLEALADGRRLGRPKTLDATRGDRLAPVSSSWLHPSAPRGGDLEQLALLIATAVLRRVSVVDVTQ